MTARHPESVSRHPEMRTPGAMIARLPVAGCRLPVLALACAALGLLAARTSAQQEAPYTYAITGARIVPVSSAPIDNATIVFSDGLITQVGAGVAAPVGAQVITGRGLTVYPGLIDMGSGAGLETPTIARADNPQTTEDVERVKKETLLRADLRAADYMNPKAAALARAAAAGITATLATPGGDGIRGQSALVFTALGADAPQIGALADERRGVLVIKTPVALHLGTADRPAGGDAYPNSLMGLIAFNRQAFLDATWYQQAKSRPNSAALEAMQPALARRMPVAFRAATAREILRALDMASSFKLDPIITSAREVDPVTTELKSADARVIYSLNFPTRPVSLAPDADEPLNVLKARANAPKGPSALEKAGIPFAFESSGLSDPKDFLKNAQKTVAGGLSRDAALKALTMNGAALAGVGDRLGSLDRGKIANLIVTDGDLFDEKTSIKHIFVNGRLVRP
jgi:imidazolonepropionase-like amidohydrolase